MRKLLLSLFVALLATPAWGVIFISHPPGTNLASLGTCAAGREGLIRKVTDGDSRTDCNPTGTGDFTVDCACIETATDTYSWQAIITLGAPDSIDPTMLDFGADTPAVNELVRIDSGGTGDFESGPCTMSDGGALDCPAHATDGGALTLKEGQDDGSNTFQLKVPDSGLSANNTCTMTASGLLPESNCLDLSIISGKVDRNNTAVNDDDCTGEQGLWWYDTTDSQFEFCNSGSGAPATLAAGAGDAIEVEDGDDGGTFTAIDTTARFEDQGDINFVFADGGAGGPDTVTALVRANSVALSTDTTGNYVLDVADGTGIDGTAAAEGATYTPVLDLTEINDHTFGDNTDATLQQIFDPTGTGNPTWSYTDGVANLSSGALQVAGVAVSTGSHTPDQVGTVTDGSYCQGGATSVLDCDVLQEDIPGADHIGALTEIAQGIKTAANDTDPLAVFTGGNPAGNVCVEMNSSGQLLSAGDTCANLGPGGTPTLDAILDPAAATTLVSGTTTETFDFDFQAAFTTGDQFQVRQSTGNPTGGRLVSFEAADADVTVFHAGTGTDGLEVTQPGRVRLFNSVDQASTELMRLEGDRATPTDDDEIYETWYLSDDLGNQQEFGRISLVGTLLDNTLETAVFTFDVIGNGSLSEALRLGSSQAVLPRDIQTGSSAVGPGRLTIREDSDNGTAAFVIEAASAMTVSRTGTLPAETGGEFSLLAQTIDDTEMTNESFGEFSCDGTEDGCTIDAYVVEWPLKPAGFTVDGTQCSDPATTQYGSGPRLYGINCTDNAASEFQFDYVTPDGWNAGTVIVELTAINANATPSGILDFDISCMCRGDSDLADTNWGTAQNVSITFTTQNDFEFDDTAAITPNGTCVAGDLLVCRGLMDNVATTTQVADTDIVGGKITFTSNFGD